MSDTRDLLIEIGTEELPPKALEGLSEAFSSAICGGLEQQEIAYNIATPYATPRRLAVLLKGVATFQPDREIERRGPALAAAFKDGKPSPALLGFARSCGVEVEALSKLETDKGSWFVYRSLQKGQATEKLVPAIVEAALAALPIPKRMRWGSTNFEFVRPVHWVVLLFGKEVIEAEILGIKAGRETRGHRFHHPEPLVLAEADDYGKALEKQGYVIPVFSTRRERVRILVEEAADLLGGQAVIDEALLSEVTSLVEYPVAITGSFEEKFLSVPAEALIASMKGHQKYFHVVSAEGKLLPNFIAISNLQSTQPEVVRAGNERVIRPRLSDAAFFWGQDCAHALEQHLDTLKTVVFQNALGTLYEKSQRVAELSGTIAKALGANELHGIRAAQLSKCDLMSNMVGEFPELQGIMGEYYARHDSEHEAVAVALREQYMPRFAGDALPSTPIGQAVAIADKLDTLVGIFGIGQPPTGDKDPFGLRRAALGVLRIAIEQKLPLDLLALLQQAQAAYPAGVIKVEDTYLQVFDFMLERLRSYYQDQGVHYDSVDAVLSCRPHSPLDADKRIRGVEAFRSLPAAVSLASANKRVHNLLKKTEQTFPQHPEAALFTEEAERQLHQALAAQQGQLDAYLQQGNYAEALQLLAGLRESVDTFFEKVMVMDENPTIRNNRLALLQTMRAQFLKIADISRLQL